MIEASIPGPIKKLYVYSEWILRGDARIGVLRRAEEEGLNMSLKNIRVKDSRKVCGQSSAFWPVSFCLCGNSEAYFIHDYL